MANPAINRRSVLKGSGALAGMGVFGAPMLNLSVIAAQDGETLVYAQNLQLKNLDPGNPLDYPSSYDALYAIYSRLVTFDADMQFQPDLAESYEVSEDGTSWTFVLKQGVLFHDGTPFDAEAVKVHFERLAEQDPPIPRPNGGTWRRYLQEVVVEDAHTVTIVTNEPLGAMLNYLAHGSGGIISPASLEEFGDDVGLHPVGTGPYKVVEFNVGENLLLERYEDYHGTPPSIQRLEMRPILESAARIAALETGEADVIYEVPPVDVQRLEANPDIQIIRRPSLRGYYIGLNLQRPAFESKAVRQALNYAVDKDSIIQALFFGYATAMDSPFAPDLFSYTSVKSYDYDLDLANQLLDEDGWVMGTDGVRQKDDVRLAGNLLIAEGEYPQDIQVGQAVQSQLQEIGMELELWRVEASVRISNHMRNETLVPEEVEYDSYFWAFNPSTGDPGSVMSLFDWRLNALDQPVSNWNMVFYDNPTVNDLIGQGETATDLDVRETIYQQIQEIVMEDAPYIYLYVPDGIIAARSNVSGVNLMPVVFVRFDEASKG